MSSKPEDRHALAHRLASLEGRKKIDALLDAPDPQALVRSLPAEDLYFTIKEVGIEDAGELVELASPAQFRTFVDLDVWRRGTLHPRALFPWLRAASEGEDFRKKLLGLDVEVVELLLRETVALSDLEEDPDCEPLGTFWRSPEGRYMVDFQVEGDDLVTLRRVVESYYDEDPFLALRFLEAVRWELPAELEETALRWRSGRLADLGFPELEQALGLYAYVDPDAPLPGVGTRAAEPVGFFLETLGSQSFLDQALGQLDAEALSRIDRELLSVFNGALVADAVEPGHLEDVRRALASARSHLSLGLEYVAQGDAARGAELLLTAPIASIFKVASGLTLKRKFRADRLVAGGFAGMNRTRSWFDAPLGATLDALRKKRPQFNAALEKAESPTALRPFRSRAELAQVDAALTQAEALAQLAQRLGIVPKQVEAAALAARAELASEVKLSEVVLHLALQGRGTPVETLRPLTPTELGLALGWAISAGEPSPELQKLVRDTLLGGTSPEGVAGELAEFTLLRAREELAPLARLVGRLEPALLATAPILLARP